RGAAQRGVGLQLDAVHAHRRRPRRLAAPEDRAESAPPAVHSHGARHRVQVRGVRAVNYQLPTPNSQVDQLGSWALPAVHSARARYGVQVRGVRAVNYQLPTPNSQVDQLGSWELEVGNWGGQVFS